MQGRTLIALGAVVGALTLTGGAAAANGKGAHANGFWDGPLGAHAQGASTWTERGGNPAGASGWRKPAGSSVWGFSSWTERGQVGAGASSLRTPTGRTAWGASARTRSRGGVAWRFRPHPFTMKGAAERG